MKTIPAQRTQINNLSQPKTEALEEKLQLKSILIAHNFHSNDDSEALEESDEVNDNKFQFDKVTQLFV